MKEKCGKAARAHMKSNDVITGRIRWVLNNINEQRRDTNTEKQKSGDVLSSSVLGPAPLSASVLFPKTCKTWGRSIIAKPSGVELVDRSYLKE